MTDRIVDLDTIAAHVVEIASTAGVHPYSGDPVADGLIWLMDTVDALVAELREAREAVAARDQTIKQLHRSLDGADECYDNLHAARSRDAEARIAAAVAVLDTSDAPAIIEASVPAAHEEQRRRSLVASIRKALTGDRP